MSEYTNALRARILAEALPHISRYYGKTIVVKYGGNAMTSDDLKKQVMNDIALLNKVGVRIVLVHGGGPELSNLMERVGKKPEFINGLRVTDQETIDLAQMVLAGKINKTLVNLIQAAGGMAVGLSGMDARLIEAKIRDEKYGFVGDVTKINTEVINDLLDKGYIPVISTLGCDQDGNTYNINGDTAAGKIAGALNAERMILLTDVRGVMKDMNDESSLIPELTINEARKLKEDGTISGGMIPKVKCCIDAVEAGVEAVVILDGRVPHAILMETLTDEGAGTMIRR